MCGSQFPRSLHYDAWWQRIVRLIHTFVVLGLGRPIQLNSFRVSREVESPGIDVFVVSLPAPAPPLPEHRAQDEVLFTCNDMGADASRIFAAWLDSAKRLRPVYRLYTALVRRPLEFETDLDFQFLGFIQALEAYLSRTGSVYHMGAPMA